MKGAWKSILRGAVATVAMTACVQGQDTPAAFFEARIKQIERLTDYFDIKSNVRSTAANLGNFLGGDPPGIGIDDVFPILSGRSRGGRLFRQRLFPPAASPCLRS